MAIEKAKNRNPESIKSEWLKPDNIISFLSLLVAAWALYYSSQSNDATIKALELQSRQAVETSKKDSLNNIQDSIKNERFFELSQQQVDALKQQVQALQSATRMDEQSKRPILDVMKFGFHILDEKSGISALKFKVINRGRRAQLTGIGIAIFNEDFKCTIQHFEKTNTVLVDDKTHETHLILPINGKEKSYWSLEDLLKFPTTYFCISTRYQDSFEQQPQQDNYLYFLKWTSGESTETISIDNGLKYYGFDNCSTREESLMKKALKKQNLLKIINPKI